MNHLKHTIQIEYVAFRTYYSMGREIKRPKREKEHQQRPSTNRHRDITPTAVNLQAAYRTVVPLHVASKRVIRYGNTSNVVRILCVCHK